MSSINFHKTYQLGDDYETVKQRASKKLGPYFSYPGLFIFDDQKKNVTFKSEKLIPGTFTNRPRVLLLLSNPHPFSVHQGMFLSPNSLGQRNLFWHVMEDAGWITFKEKNLDPTQLAEICLQAKYQGPFDLIFYCYYAFPTAYPEEIKMTFGTELFRDEIEPGAREEFRKVINETSSKAIVTFNKGIFNLVSNSQIENYIGYLKDGGLIRGQMKGIEPEVPIFLSFPTGWHYHKEYRLYRKASLDAIKAAICST